MLAKIFKYPDLVLVVVWVLYSSLDFLTMGILDMPIDMSYAMANLIFGFLFSCLMYYWLLPKIVIAGEWARGILATLLLVIVLSIVKFYFQFPDVWFWAVGFKVIWLEWLRIIQFQGLTFSIWIILAFYIVSKDNLEKKAWLDELTIQHQSLQLGPHFVLNMMNEIKASAKGLSDELSEEIDQFSIVLKYSYKDLRSQNFLIEEIVAIQAYAFCQKRRFGRYLRQHVVTEFSEETASRLFMPKMVLLTLFSDIFKHGDYLGEVPSQVSLKLATSAHNGNMVLCFSIFNLIGKRNQIEESGFGLKTVSAVLSYYFEDDVQLFFEAAGNEFSLLLTIDYGR